MCRHRRRHVLHQRQDGGDVIPPRGLFGAADEPLNGGPDVRHGMNPGQNLLDLSVPQSIAQAVGTKQIHIARVDLLDPGIGLEQIARVSEALIDLVAQRMVTGLRFGDLSLLAQPAHW